MRLNKIYLAKFTVSLPAEQSMISNSYQPLVNYVEVSDNSLLSRNPAVNIGFC